MIQIKEQLSTHSFKNKTRSEKHNYNCFTDFLQFLEFNITTKDKDYVEYRYGEKSIEDNSIQDYKVAFFKILEDFHNEKNSFNEIQYNLVKNKLIEVEEKLENEAERNSFYNLLTQFPVSTIIDRVSVMELDQLIEQFYNMYEKS